MITNVARALYLQRNQTIKTQTYFIIDPLVAAWLAHIYVEKNHSSLLTLESYDTGVEKAKLNSAIQLQVEKIVKVKRKPSISI